MHNTLSGAKRRCISQVRVLVYLQEGCAQRMGRAARWKNGAVAREALKEYQ
jgi:hypothetical protein